MIGWILLIVGVACLFAPRTRKLGGVLLGIYALVLVGLLCIGIGVTT